MNSPTSGEWSDQEFDVFDGDTLVGHILRSHAASLEGPWLWTTIRPPAGGTDGRGYAKSLEAAMAALTLQWEAAGAARG